MIESKAEYKNYLTKLYHTYTKTDEGFIRVQEDMKKKYPGNYIVEECYNPRDFKWDIRLKFSDPDEELLFMLKWA